MSELAVAPEDRAQPPEQEFEDLYLAARGDVYAYVATVLRDRSAAEDVTAAAFERAYRRRSSYRSTRGSRRAWLFGIARNAALDELRRRQRVAPLEEDAGEVDAPSVVESAELALKRATVRAALEGLSGRERELVALKFDGGLTNAEIAAVLGVSESNVGTMLHRTITKLRKACNETAT